MSAPKVYPAPRGDRPHPLRSSGSLQSKSHIAPSWGTKIFPVSLIISLLDPKNKLTFLNTIECSYVVKIVYARTKPSMKPHNLIFNKCGERQIVKKIGEIFPNVGVSILAQTLIVKAVNLRNLSGFMVSSKNEYSAWKSDFKAYQKRDGFYAIVSSIDIIAKEEVVSVRCLSPNSKKLHKIMKLSVNIATDGNRCINFLNIFLLNEYFASFLGEKLHVIFRNIVAFQKLLDPFVKPCKPIGIHSVVDYLKHQQNSDQN